MAPMHGVHRGGAQEAGLPARQVRRAIDNFGMTIARHVPHTERAAISYLPPGHCRQQDGPPRLSRCIDDARV